MIALQSSGLARESVREHVDRVLARDEFHRADSALLRWLDEKLTRFAEWFGHLVGVSDPHSAKVAFLVFLVLFALALLWALVRTLRDAPTTPPVGGTVPSVESARAAGVAALRRAAAAAARANDFTGALRLYFRALVLGLSERGDLRYRDAWTNRELLERGSPRPEVLPLLAPLVPRLDAQSFGRESAGPDDVARLERLCDRLLGGASP